MNGRAKVRIPILDEMCLQIDYTQVEDTIIHALFSHAVTDLSTLPPLSIINIDHPLSELNSPFTLGELQVAISQASPSLPLVTIKLNCKISGTLPHTASMLYYIWPTTPETQARYLTA
ncbi:hypothetical protein HPB48_018902 [Haemaphysalis longicornis]|uniref:Uncharacterized protein n=1 Tax=Haemaphysalis longicornis TaxID=44386 RepID=A0A9J6G309_HAELO|nr:hypothetical protein HPB48_018902 [Haemaphysalis longicornis]